MFNQFVQLNHSTQLFDNQLKISKHIPAKVCRYILQSCRYQRSNMDHQKCYSSLFQKNIIRKYNDKVKVINETLIEQLYLNITIYCCICISLYRISHLSLSHLPPKTFFEILYENKYQSNVNKEQKKYKLFWHTNTKYKFGYLFNILLSLFITRLTRIEVETIKLFFRNLKHKYTDEAYHNTTIKLNNNRETFN